MWAWSIERPGRRHQHLERVIDRLEPGTHLFLEAARQKPECIAHGDDRPADRQAVVLLGKYRVKPRADCEKRLASAGRAVAGDQGDGGIEQRIEEALLPEVYRPQIDPARDVEGLRDQQPLETALGEEPGGHGLALAGAQEHVFIEHHAREPRIGDLELAGAGEPLELVRMDLDAAQVVALDVARLDLVIEVILAPQPHGERLQVHVEVLGHQDRRNLLRLLDQEHVRQDAVIHPLGVRKDMAEAIERGAGLFRVIEHREADRAAAIRRDPLGHCLAILRRKRCG